MNMNESNESSILGNVRDHMRKPLSQWTDDLRKGLDNYDLGPTEFRAYTDIPKDPSDEVVIVGGEHGNSFWGQHDRRTPNPALVRAHVIRDAVDPHASLVYMAGDAIGERNLNLTSREIHLGQSGFMTPLADRWEAILEQLPNTRELTHGTGVGMSLGATVLSEVMLSNKTLLEGAVYVEAPNVAKRTARELGKAFLTSGAHLADNIRLNDDPVHSEIAAEHIKSVNPMTARGALGMGRFVAGMALASNRAVLMPMLRPTLAPAIEASLVRGNTVVHAWGTQADVSPYLANHEIRNQFKSHPNYSSFEIDDENADHSLTNQYALMGALARHATQ